MLTGQESLRLDVFSPFREANGKVNADKNGVDVVLITEGPGNKKNRNFYPAETLARSASVFEGTKCFLNHPTEREAEEQPERDATKLAGWYSNVRTEDVAGKTALVARLNYSKNASGREARELVESALAYQKQYPDQDKVLCGFSILGAGPSSPMDHEGQPWNRVEAIEVAESADLVATPARGGRPLGYREAEAWAETRTWRRRFRESLAGPRTTLALLRDRVKEGPAAFDDIKFALAEADLAQLNLPPDKLGRIQDLQRQATAVESTHDPLTIQKLLQALTIFLDEELAEEAAEEAARANAMGTDTDPVTGTATTPDGTPIGDGNADLAPHQDVRAAPGGDAPPPQDEPQSAVGVGSADDTNLSAKKTEGPDGKPAEPQASDEPDKEAGKVAARRAAAAKDNYSRYADDSREGATPTGEAATCEACGYRKENSMTEATRPEPIPATTPEAPPTAVTPAREAGTAGEAGGGASVVQITEAERAELLAYRAKARKEELKESAQKAINERGLTGLVEAAELSTFSEDQWPVVLKLAEAGPPRTYGTGEPMIAAPQNARPAPQSAADVYRARMGRPSEPAAA